VTASEAARGRLEETGSWLSVDAWAFGVPKPEAPSTWVEQGRLDVWLETVRVPENGIVRLPGVRTPDERLAALADPDYIVNINVRCTNTRHVAVGLRCEPVTDHVRNLRGRTLDVPCKLPQELGR